MNSVPAPKAPDSGFKPLPKNFNFKKFSLTFSVVNNPNLTEIQNLGRRQCLGKSEWPLAGNVNAWMITAETATFMKWGGLGMVASELPEAFNRSFAGDGDVVSVVTPLYAGDTGKKKARLEADVYYGAEKKSVKVEKLLTLKVPFYGNRSTLTKYNVGVYRGRFENVEYVFLQNERFFSINPHPDNNPAQDGCYIRNEFDINEVERFAFFSKAVYILVKTLFEKSKTPLKVPNLLIANDWHSGALAGLTKYFSIAQLEAGLIDDALCGRLKNLPVVHLAHHLGYQGWDYPNTSKILNSLYENTATAVFKNAKAIKNSNPRTCDTLIVYDCYNQASCNFHLADRVVTVSKNYMEEVSKELDFGFDFRDILKIRKDHRNFFGIVNGYDKKLITPNPDRIEAINRYFAPFNFKFYDENHLEAKLENKKEFIRLISKIASDPDFKQKVIPLVDTYRFNDLSKKIKNIEHTPIVCATSRLVEQKGYDIAAQAITNLFNRFGALKNIEMPIFLLGGAGDSKYFEHLTNLKDRVMEKNPKCGERIFVFRGYQDDFAYAIQMASDFYMMPSRFEPCGLTQMEAMAKGALPVAMSTGGLVDTIENGVDGFRTEVFFSSHKRRVYGNNLTAQRLKNNTNAYAETLCKALETFYCHFDKIRRMTVNAMRKDFSWDVEGGSIYKYRQLFKTGHL